MLIDYHAHVNFNAYKDDAKHVIDRALSNKVQMVLVGAQYSTSERAVQMAAEYPDGVWAAVGLHPTHLIEQEIKDPEASYMTRSERFDAEAYAKLAAHPKVVAIGECGLDYYHFPHGAAVDDIEAMIEEQKETLREHIHLASDLNLPLILHCRPRPNSKDDAYWDLINIIKEERAKGYEVNGVAHCFLGTEEAAADLVGLGIKIGFTGIITFKNAVELQNVARNLPMDAIVVETDCPYLAPVPHRGERNEPLYVRYVAKKIAELRHADETEVEDALYRNTVLLFPKMKA